MTIDPKEWQPILAEGFNPPSYDSAMAKSVVGEDLTKHRVFTKAIPNWRWALWGTSLEDMTASKDTKWKRESFFGIDRHREGPPAYSIIPVALNKERAVLDEGGAVIRYAKDKRFLFTVNPSWKQHFIKVIANDDQRESVEAFFGDLSKWADEHNFYRGAKLTPKGRFLDLSDVSEADLILEPTVKTMIFRNVKTMVEKWADYAKFGIPGKRGVILAGSPGNGKTLSMKVLAKQLDCTFLWCTPNDVMESEGFGDIFAFARELAPTVLLIEDADGFGLDRRLGGFNPALSDLLNQMDGLVENKGVVTMLSSNYADMLDSALTRRPGRFDAKIRVDPPRPQEAFEIIRRTLEKRKVTFQGDPAVLKNVAGSLAKVGASGAYIVESVNYAMMLAVERGRGTGRNLQLTPEDIKESADWIIANLRVDEDTEKSIAAEGLYKWGYWENGWENVRKRIQRQEDED